MTFLTANNASSTLAQALPASGAGSTTAVLQPGAGAAFPAPGTGQQFALTLSDAATGLITEICYCTNRSTDTLTLVRAQEGTTALAWAAGSPAQNRITAGVAAAGVQQDQLQEGTYQVATITSGSSANAIKASLPSDLTAPQAGQTVVILAAAPCGAGGVTLELTLGVTDLGALPIVKLNGAPLIQNDIPSAGYPILLNWSPAFDAWVMSNPASPALVSIGFGLTSNAPPPTANQQYNLVDAPGGKLISSAGSWSTFFNDMLVNPYNDTGASWINQGSAVLSKFGPFTLLSAPSVGGNDIIFRGKPISGITWPFKMLIRPESLNASYMGGGLAMSDGTKFKTFGTVGSPSASQAAGEWYSPVLSVDNWTNSSTYSAPFLQRVGMPIAGALLWLEINLVAGNWVYSYSHNGVNFTPFYSEAANTFLTSTLIGFFLNPTYQTLSPAPSAPGSVEIYSN